MADFSHIPLGQPIPNLPHAVSCSLPTMADVRGYEEKDPKLLKQLGSGYPRFVVHPFARRLASELVKRHGLGDRILWLASSERMARGLLGHLASEQASLFSGEGVSGVTHPAGSELAVRCKLYLQHIGGFLSSRHAEDLLAALGLGAAPAPENLFKGDSLAAVRLELRRAFPGVPDTGFLIANSGMNAGFAAFKAISELQSARGRKVWIQLGWLYLDTIAILKKFSGPAGYAYAPNVADIEALEGLFARHSGQVAGVLTEAPTNPLVQMPDLAAISSLCRRNGARLILDPSVASPFSVNCLAHSDVVVASLTKYTGNEGDVIAGLAVVNPAGPDSAELLTRIRAELEPVYPRDLARLAAQIQGTAETLARIEANVPIVAAYLAGHPKVREVYWALRSDSRENFLRHARNPAATGGMISFTLRTPMEPVYDRLRLPKGPSFGMKTTLICPFMYLAHYDLVTSAAGRAELAASGLDPDLLRLSVGAEPADEIIGALAEALA